MSSNEEIGRRVLESLDSQQQATLAARVGMTPDAMSRAVRGHRGFSSVEIASIAEALAVDVYWLITGQVDPIQVRVAARHDYDFETGKRSVPGREGDESPLGAIELAYRQAYPEPLSSEAGEEEQPVRSDELPTDPASMRDALGDDFVRYFADGVEQRLGVDVIRLEALSTAYSLTIGGRRVIVLPATENWWHSNSSLAHELGHLALGHHDAGTDDPSNEPAANRFATELLLPEHLLRSQPWGSMTAEDTARFVWDTGVSGVFLLNRLIGLDLDPSADAKSVLSGKMPGLLRRYTNSLGEPLIEKRGPFGVPVDPIDKRMSAAKERRFPTSLLAAHQEAVDSGRVNPATLAWMRGYDAERSDGTDAPEAPNGGSNDFSDFGL